jgi:hypothetical protein
VTTLRRLARWLAVTACQVAVVLALRVAVAVCAGKLLAAW